MEASKAQKRPRPGKRKASSDGGGNSFGSALRAVLAQPIPKKSSTPILAAARPNPQLLKQRQEEKATKEAAKLAVAKHKWYEKEHVVPDSADANYEKLLLKLATKGIVKLFNAVQAQQQQRLEEKGKNVVAPKPDKMTKGQFLDMLKGGGKPDDSSRKGTSTKPTELDEDDDAGGGDDDEGEDDDELDEDDEGEDDMADEDDEDEDDEDSDADEGGPAKKRRPSAPRLQAEQLDGAEGDDESESSFFSEGGESVSD